MINEGKFFRKVNKDAIPFCEILGVQIAAIDMTWLVDYINRNITNLSGDYITVANVHTTVMTLKDKDYLNIQNSAVMAIPDGGPLCSEARKRGHPDIARTTGPDLMKSIFEITSEYGYRHYFLGSTQNTLDKLQEKLLLNYPGIQIVGTFSPPFRSLTEEEDVCMIDSINHANPDFVWVGLGAPKQEQWVYAHQGKVKGLMIGVGAGFDYHAGNIKRAPKWVQKLNMEWCYRLLQDPKRLLKRYWNTNTTFIWEAVVKGK